MLNRLKKANPNLKIIRPGDSEFARYGRVIDSDEWRIVARRAGERIIPGEDPAYIPSVSELEDVSVPARTIGRVFGGEEAQVGICRGYNDRMNGMEWHDCPEIIVAVTPLMLLLGHVDDMQRKHWDSSLTVACFLDAGETVVLEAGTLHFAPCRVSDEPFLSLIILARGVNYDRYEADDEEPLLWKNRKWLIAHPESPQAAAGVTVGVDGANLVVAV